MSVVIETTIGDITVDLFIDERPVACLNFLKLCKLKYYNFNLFHTVEQGFIAQTGDPTGAGDGGSSVWGVVEGPQKRFFEAEYLPKIKHTTPGLLSLVSVGKNLVGSQFFFTLGENLVSLDGVHCVIGEVVEGHETLRKLNDAIVDESFRPYQDIRVTHTIILDDPFPNPRGFKVPSRSPSPSAERMKNGRIAADDDINDTDGKSMEELQEILAEREAKARATILEIVGDLPDADMAPPENVLFVCKLNPVTTDDDLEIIFSRFGVVKNCEVIRDRKTGDSLQYAFVEFDNQKSCEAAYFKMDNVLIDDRRIHVDFSQSVAKVKWRGKGRGVEGPEGRLDFNNLKDTNSRRKDESMQDRRSVKQRPNQNYDDTSKRRNSEERRRAREERHREQRQHEKELSKSRRRSRSRTPIKNREESRRHYENHRPIERYRYERRRSRSVERGRKRNLSPEKRSCTFSDRRSADRRQVDKSNNTSYASNRHSKNERYRDSKHKQDDIKKKPIKVSRNKSTSASDSDSDSIDESESSSSTSSSSTSKSDSESSSSDDKRSKRKKGKKEKHKKSKSKNHKQYKRKHKK